MHKSSRTEGGQLGIVWWNREYWDVGMGLKRLKVKKEEPLMYLGCDKDQWRWRSKCMSYVVLRGAIREQ